jgi:N-acetylneuraminic acid mutarotase
MMGEKRATLTLLLILSSLLVGLPNIAEVRAAEDSWTTKEPMLTARYRFGIAVVERKIYAIGGRNFSDLTLDTNEEYDPVTDTWETKYPMHTPRYYFAVAVYQNKIYTFGGVTDPPNHQENTYVGVNEVYDPATDTWETKTPMPTNRSALCANVVEDKIYLTGGIVYGPPPAFSSYTEVTEVYDPENDSWTTKASIPTPVCSYTSAVVNNKIHIIGGSTGHQTYTSFNQIYDPETDTWTEMQSIPTGVRFAAAGATTGTMAPKRIYVQGGSTAQFPDGSNLTQVYDPEKDVWSAGTPMLTPRGGLRVAVVNDELYAIGGFTNGENVLGVNELYTTIGYIPEFPSWIILPLILIMTLGVMMVRNKLSKKRVE